MAWTRGQIQHERAYSIAITGNLHATSERIPQDFHNSSRVSSRASESSESLEKTIQNRSRERLRGSQNRLKIGRGPSWDAPWQPRAVRERLGSVLGRPRRGPGAPRESPKTLRDARKSVREHPGARRGDQNQPQVASGSEKIAFLSPGSCTKRHRSDFPSIFIDFCFLCEVREPSKVLRLPAKTKVRPLALRVESVARCNLKKR